MQGRSGSGNEGDWTPPDQGAQAAGRAGFVCPAPCPQDAPSAVQSTFGLSSSPRKAPRSGLSGPRHTFRQPPKGPAVLGRGDAEGRPCTGSLRMVVSCRSAGRTPRQPPLPPLPSSLASSGGAPPASPSQALVTADGCGAPQLGEVGAASERAESYTLALIGWKLFMDQRLSERPTQPSPTFLNFPFSLSRMWRMHTTRYKLKASIRY